MRVIYNATESLVNDRNKLELTLENLINNPTDIINQQDDIKKIIKEIAVVNLAIKQLTEYVVENEDKPND
jgi:hypothetical protein